MRLEWARPGVLHATAHVYEFSALVAAARHVVESAPPEIPPEALEGLRKVLADYDGQAEQLRETGAAKPQGR
ncbi:hypothetical protein [Streptomyces sp. 891-h]|uniref:hypothetical protein n=1 Tax=unclassified Streptomyces TaxID=2593676 RepID=UPI001FA9E139|nr:hypothetical protein [Streptomyces sp. 891-h]UNZ17522.1 hypothetical protein HC362_11100 [Streptomyces sp. 891-h]